MREDSQEHHDAVAWDAAAVEHSGLPQQPSGRGEESDSEEEAEEEAMDTANHEKVYSHIIPN